MNYRRRFSRTWPAVLSAAFFLMLAAGNASADLIMDLGAVLNGSIPAGGESPWLTAEFRAGDEPGTVLLTLRSRLADPSEFISQFAMNVAPAIDPASVAITQTSGEPVARILAGKQDAQDVAGAGRLGKGFDILLNWPTSNGSERFQYAETAAFTLWAAGLTPEMFDCSNAVGDSKVAAKVQGIAGATSGVIKEDRAIQVTPIPEPATMALIVAACAPLVLLRLLRLYKR